MPSLPCAYNSAVFLAEHLGKEKQEQRAVAESLGRLLQEFRCSVSWDGHRFCNSVSQLSTASCRYCEYALKIMVYLNVNAAGHLSTFKAKSRRVQATIFSGLFSAFNHK